MAIAPMDGTPTSSKIGTNVVPRLTVLNTPPDASAK